MHAALARLVSCLVGALCLIAAGCEPTATPTTGSSLRVVVSLPPLAGLVGPLLPPGSAIEVLLPPGASEHGYEIPPGRLSILARADVVVLVGMGMEPQIEKALHERARAGQLVLRFASLVGIDDPEAGHPEPDHGVGDHHHQADPHLWLDAGLADAFVIAAGTRLADLLKSRGSGSAAAGVVAAAHATSIRIRQVDAEYRRALDARTRRTIIVSHDAWGRLAARYRLRTVALKGLTAGEPTAADLKAAIDTVAAEKLTTIFLEPQISPALADRVAAATGARVATLDPLGDGDWFALMQRNLAAIVQALSEPK